MSLRLRLLDAGLRRVARPMLARTKTPEKAGRDFERAAALGLRQPPYLCRLPGEVAGIPVHWLRCGPAAPRRLLLYLHGGAFFSGSGRTHAGLAGRLARLAGLEVCLPDYRLLQEAPFPAAVEDVTAVWDGLLARGWRPGDIALAGDSAGGGLACTLLAETLARGTPPAAIYLMSPWCDLTLTGATLASPGESLIPVHRMAEVVDLYLAGADPADPRASPLFAAYPAPPPALVQVGSGECLFDDSRRLAERLGARLSVWPGCPHVWQIFDGWLPEARAALREGAAFLQASFDSDSR